MQNVLFVCQTCGKDLAEATFCGIGIRGKLTIEILQQSTQFHYIPCYANSNSELEGYIVKHEPIVVIYNYHDITTPWMQNAGLRVQYPHITHVMIHYDVTQHMVDFFHPGNFHGFQYVITDNDTLNLSSTSNVLLVCRSIPEYIHDGDACVPPCDIPKIGFQGFGFPHKGIDNIAHKVVEEFDEAVIRLHIPYSMFGDPRGDQARSRVAEVQSIISSKPNIRVEVSHDFMKDEDIVKWLHENDVNCYFFAPLESSGIASSPDYAIAAKKPIAIKRSHMLRHFWNLDPSISIEDLPLKTIMNNGIAPLKPIYQKYNRSNVVRDYDAICKRLSSRS